MTQQTKTLRRPTARGWSAIRPRSVTGLLLASFALVALPMLAATLFSVTYVDRLSGQSERLVLRGVQVARVSKRLDTLLTAMERSARQYAILGNPMLAARVAEHNSDFDDTLHTLRDLHLESMPSWNLDLLNQQADRVAAAVEQGAHAVNRTLDVFTTMHEETALIMQQGNVFIDAELKRLQDTSRQARRFLLICIVTLIPGVILLALVFTVVISRPVRQISRAINHIGKGGLDQTIHVAAPSAEFDALGNQLDWMRRRLATLEAERNQFLRHMSHELKTPLASIREGAELLRDGTVGALQPGQQEVADIIQRNSLELLSLIENLLDFAAWQQQQVKLEYSHFDLQQLIVAVVRRQTLTLSAKNLSIAQPDQPMMLTADRDRVQLIIDNLLSNAVKFSPEQGNIRISITRARDTMTLTVCDQGPGITAAERERIFEAFYQTRNAQDQPPVRGTGIGLSVVSECVHAHEGQIEVTPAAGGGACFHITLPVRGSAAHAH